MKKVTKAIKLVNGFSDEEKQEFAEFFKSEETEEIKEEVVEDKKEEVKVEVKEEPKKEEKDTPNFEQLFKNLEEKFNVVVEEVKTLKTQQVEKIGVKAKPKTPKDGNSFDNIFAKLTSNQ